MVFTVASQLEDSVATCEDLRGRMAAYGRAPRHLKLTPANVVIMAGSLAEAEGRRAELDTLVNSDSAIAALSIAIGQDASQWDPDGLLPETPESSQSKSGRERTYLLVPREPDGTAIGAAAGRFKWSLHYGYAEHYR